eukprot:2604789-Rhodomonas_salina.2
MRGGRGVVKGPRHRQCVLPKSMKRKCVTKRECRGRSRGDCYARVFGDCKLCASSRRALLPFGIVELAVVSAVSPQTPPARHRETKQGCREVA